MDAILPVEKKADCRRKRKKRATRACRGSRGCRNGRGSWRWRLRRALVENVDAVFEADPSHQGSAESKVEETFIGYRKEDE
jgi:hypothetical protein